MTTITVEVTETVYLAFENHARAVGRPVSELILDAIEMYLNEHIKPRLSLKNLQPLSLGKTLRPLEPDEDLFDEMCQPIERRDAYL